MLAHQGGWDEVLLPIVIVLLVFAYGTRNRNKSDEPPAESGPCAYCGHPLTAEDERCPECGFRRLIAA